MDIQSHRKNASLESKGTSSSEIVSAILKEVSDDKFHFHKMLDIGCGTGNLLSQVKKIKTDIVLYGADYTDFSNLASKGIIFKQVDCNENFSELFDTFDLITTSEVIEHLENGRHFLRQLEKMLTPKGRIIITTPNPESLTSIISFIVKGYHSAFGPKEYPAHINSYTFYELSNIIKETQSLKISNIEYIQNGRIPGTSLKWIQIFPFLKLFKSKRFSDNFLITISKNLP